MKVTCAANRARSGRPAPSALLTRVFLGGYRSGERNPMGAWHGMRIRHGHFIYISLYHFIAHFIYIYIYLYIFISLMFKLGKTSMNGSWRFPVAMLDCWKLRCERCEIQVCDEVWHFTTTVAPTCFHQFSPMVCQSSNVFMYVCVCLSACMHVKDSICTYIYTYV